MAKQKQLLDTSPVQHTRVPSKEEVERRKAFWAERFEKLPELLA